MSRYKAAESLSEARIVSWHSKYKEGVLALFSDVPYKAKLWEWQFESNPFGWGFDPVVLVDKHDQVIGFNGVMAMSANERGEVMKVVWSCDFYLHPNWRGHGLASLIKYELHQKTGMTMAFGISNQASAILRHLGWHPDDSVRAYKMVRHKSGWRSWVFGLLQLANRCFFTSRYFRGSGSSCSRVSIHARPSLPPADEVDCLWRLCAPGYERIVQRDYAYLNWRYQQHPLGRYGFVVAYTEDGLSGMLVVRLHRQHLRIVDYVGPANDQLLKQQLVRQTIINWRHVTQISVVTSDRELGRCVVAQGFIQVRGKPRFYRYEDSPVKTSWFIMAGDSDGEFLQAAHDFYDTTTEY